MAGDWKEEFRRKNSSAEEAVRVIKSGDRVSFTHGREPPTVVTRAMVARKNELKKRQSFHAHNRRWIFPGTMKTGMTVFPAGNQLCPADRQKYHGGAPR